MKEILLIINAWDPMGFFPMAPEDEYINEINMISEYVDSISDIEEYKLAKKINEIFIKSFGSDVYTRDLNECLNVAREIVYMLKRNKG